MSKNLLVILAISSICIGIFGCKTISDKSANSSTQTQTVIEEFSVEDFAKKYQELPDRLNNYENKKVKITGYAFIKTETAKTISTDDIYLEIFSDTTKKINGEMTCKIDAAYFFGLLDQKKIEPDNFYRLNTEALIKTANYANVNLLRLKEWWKVKLNQN
jgi:hypothetical protein